MTDSTNQGMEQGSGTTNPLPQQYFLGRKVGHQYSKSFETWLRSFADADDFLQLIETFPKGEFTYKNPWNKKKRKDSIPPKQVVLQIRELAEFYRSFIVGEFVRHVESGTDFRIVCMMFATLNSKHPLFDTEEVIKQAQELLQHSDQSTETVIQAFSENIPISDVERVLSMKLPPDILEEQLLSLIQKYRGHSPSFVQGQTRTDVDA